MFLLKQFIKALAAATDAVAAAFALGADILAATLGADAVGFTFLLILALHSGPVNYVLRYPLESRYPPLVDPAKAGTYDAIVVLTGGSLPATGLIPFPSVKEHMFRRLDEAWRLYRIRPKPIIISGGHVNPFTQPRTKTRSPATFSSAGACPRKDIIGEEKSRDTFENAVETQKPFSRSKAGNVISWSPRQCICRAA